MSDSQVRALARRLRSLEKAHLASKQPSLSFSAIDDGALSSVDVDGNLQMIVGKQYDGTQTSAVVAGPPPPQPTMPYVIPQAGALRIYWDGTFAGGGVAPMDFARVLVYAVPMASFVSTNPLDQTVVVGQLGSATGGEVSAVLEPGVEYAIYLVVWTQAGKFGPASDVEAATTGAAGGGVPGPPGADGQSLYTWVKYADTINGAGMADDPAGKTHIGLAFNKTTSIEGADPLLYTWSLIKGADGSQGLPGQPGSDGSSLFTWLKYADTPTTGMSDSPTGKTYIGLAYNKASATESAVYADYAWSLIQGPQGSTGAAGRGISSTAVTYQVGTSGTTAPTGTWTTSIPTTTTGQFLWTRTLITYTDATTSTAYAVAAHGSTGSTGSAGRGVSSTAVTYQVGTSGTVAPTGTWTTSIPTTTAGQYLWTRTITTYTDATTSTAYSVAAHGSTGAQGVPGTPGANGVSLYTWIKYATDVNGTSMSDDPTGRPYIGLAYNKSTATESTTPGDYTWSLIKGADGSQGIPGQPGPTGESLYTWLKYADDINGTGISDSSVGKKYIGLAYNKASITESSTPGDYTWALIQAPIGPGSITETELADDSISTPKLQANAVTAEILAAEIVLANQKIVAGNPNGARAELASSGFNAYRADGVKTFSVDAATGVVNVTGDLYTDAAGQPRIELTDYIGAGLYGGMGTAQVKLNPGSSVVTSGWDTTQPGFVTVQAASSLGTAGFLMELVTPQPIGYERGRLRLQSGSSSYGNSPRVEAFGTFFVYDDFASPVRVMSVDPAGLYWEGAGDYLWAQNGRIDFIVDNNVNAQRFACYDLAAVIQTKETFFGGTHQGKWVADGTKVFSGYENTSGTNVHGFIALEAGNVRAVTKATSLEVVNGNMGSYRPVQASAFTVSSDRATKTSLRVPETGALEVVRAAPSYEYDYKQEFQDAEFGRSKRIGPMANDLPDHIASYGTKDDIFGGAVQSMDLSQMVGVLWQAVQELDEELDQIRRAKPSRAKRDLTSTIPLPDRVKVNNSKESSELPDRERLARSPKPRGSGGGE